MTRDFHICTISNNVAQYTAMKRSFIAAGFDDARCRFTLFDNTRGNVHEPYEAFNRIKTETQERYLIFCHHDVLMSQGQGYEDLVRVLDELSAMDPRWAVVGNVGYNAHGELVGRLTDPWPTPLWKGPLPEPVCTLDENFLLINSSANIQLSPGLSGFHFYGPDLCLNALQRGYQCYVVDFRMEHLSKGNIDDPAFWEIKERFERHWQRYFPLVLFTTTTTQRMLLTKFAWLRPLCRLPFIQSRLHRPRPRNLAHRFGFTPRPMRR